MLFILILTCSASEPKKKVLRYEFLELCTAYLGLHAIKESPVRYKRRYRQRRRRNQYLLRGTAGERRERQIGDETKLINLDTAFC